MKKFIPLIILLLSAFISCKQASSQNLSHMATTIRECLRPEQVTTDGMKKLVDPYASNINLTGKTLIVVTFKRASRSSYFISDYLQRYLLEHNPDAKLAEYNCEDDFDFAWYNDFCESAHFEGDRVPFIIFISPEGHTKHQDGFYRYSPEDIDNIDKLITEFLK